MILLALRIRGGRWVSCLMRDTALSAVWILRLRLKELRLATRMILEICGGDASHLVGRRCLRHISVKPYPSGPIEWHSLAVCRSQDMLTSKAFSSVLVCKVDGTTTETWTVQAPTWRRDVEGEHDLVEEVLRINGYDEIPVEPLAPAVCR